jgi:hypothetical protein
MKVKQVFDGIAFAVGIVFSLAVFVALVIFFAKFGITEKIKKNCLT